MNIALEGIRRAAAAALVAATALWASGAAAQSSGQRTVTVPFASAAGSDGYLSASVGVTYSFIACMGELHIAYSLNEGSARAGPEYRLGGQTYRPTTTVPQPSTIRFAGTVYRGPQPVGSFNDGLAGKALGMGCFSGQSQKVAMIADVVGPKPTEAQVTAYLNSLRIEVRPADVLRSASAESAIRGELRRAEAEAAAAKRKAEQEAQQKAQAEAQAKAAAEQQRQAQAQQAQQAQAAQRSQVASAGGSAAPRPAAPAPMSDAERIAKAIASDKVLADQRLAEQQRAYADQQRRMAEEQQRQAQQTAAMMAAAPAVYGAIEGITDGIDQYFANRKNDAYKAAQAKLVGKCYDARNVPVPKDGEIKFGVTIQSALTTSDCGMDANDRFKAYRLVVPEASRLHVNVRGSMYANAGFVIWDGARRVKWNYGKDWGGVFVFATDETFQLPAGEYVLAVHNAPSNGFRGFTLNVTRLDAQGRTIAETPRSVAAAPAPAPRAPSPAASAPGDERAAAYAQLCGAGASTLSAATCESLKADLERSKAEAEAAELKAAYEQLCAGASPQLSAATCASMKAETNARISSAAPAAAKAR